MVWTQIRPLETPPAGPKCQYYQGRVQKVASPARNRCARVQKVASLAAREALWRRLFAHVLGNIDMLVLGSVRGRRLFAHVLSNIDILVPRGASQEVECVSKPVFL